MCVCTHPDSLLLGGGGGVVGGQALGVVAVTALITLQQRLLQQREKERERGRDVREVRPLRMGSVSSFMTTGPARQQLMSTAMHNCLSRLMRSWKNTSTIY